MNEKPLVEPVGQDRFDEVVDVLCDAFFDYPAMRFFIGDAGADYSHRLRLLIGFFTQARFLKDDLVLGIASEGGLIAAANLNRPGSTPPSPALDDHRNEVFAELGEAVRERYDAYAQATARFERPEPHYHLGMIGVRRVGAGRGYGRRILEHVHELSRSDPGSVGVTLTTETVKNVPFYQRFGYRIVGQEQVGDIETWGFFRPDETGEET
jgi:GNAT superfamily N-acetyltransferase